MAEQKQDVDAAIKSYNNPNDRFAARMRASMNKGSKAEVNLDGSAEQQNLFVDSGNVDLENKTVSNSKYYT